MWRATVAKMRPLRRFRRATISRSFRTFQAHCEGMTRRDVAKACLEHGNARLNAAAVESNKDMAAQSFELAFRFLDKGYGFEENACNPLYLWSYAQASYFTGRYRVALVLHQLLLQQPNADKLEFFQAVVLLSLIHI